MKQVKSSNFFRYSIILAWSCLIIFIFMIAMPKSKAAYTGTILETDGISALILIDEGCPIRRSGDRVYASIKKYPPKTFSVGDRVEVGYDGVVFESYPLQAGADYVKKID